MCTERDPGPARQPRGARRPDMMHPVEALPAAFVQNADEVDDGVIVRDESRQQRLVVDSDVDEPNLANIALQFEEFGGSGAAPADGQHIAALGQPLDDIAPDEPVPAEDRRAMLIHARSKKRDRIIKSLDLRQYRQHAPTRANCPPSRASTLAR